jgi:hypothetical protein
MTDRQEDERLDARLRSAARSLAVEPLPDGVLDSELAATRVGRRWVSGVAALALGLVAVALAMGSGRLGQTGDPTPWPSVFSSETRLAVPSGASPGPTIWPEYYLYAEEYGISIEETLRRMQIMEEFDSIPLREAVGNRWAGGWMEHEPEFRYVVRLTGEGWEEFLAVAAEMPLPIHFIDGAAHRESELLAAMDEIQDRLIAEGIDMSMYPDTHTGTIVLEGPQDPGAQLLDELEALTGVPVRYEYGQLPVTEPLLDALPSVTP